ncbi:MAG TPA: hydroxysqualene dehydroxylase HpnE [Thermomicrobiaceae bacterium]|nr:hydroxysqualene dehydroxylase HpnE [Thermomicrobiaceae bacterium]
MAAGRLAVVGAGLAGLAAAVELKRRGFTVELFERTRLLGGKATSFTVDGVEVDNGQHVYLGCCTEFIDFVSGVGRATRADGTTTGDLLWLQDRFEALLLQRGRPPARLRADALPSPLHLARALLGYRHLSPLDRLRLGQAVVAARRPAIPGETFGTWLERHGQGGAIRTAFWDPFLVPSLNAPLDEVDAAMGLFVVTTAFLADPGAARIGFARVPLARIAEAAAAGLDAVHLRMPVTGLDVAPSGTDPGRVRAVLLSDGGRVECDGVVLAVPPAAVARIVGDPSAFGLAGLDQFKTAPIVDVHLWYDAPGLGFGFAALLDSPVQWVFEKAPGYLCCSLSAADQHVLQPEPDLIELCHREVTAVLPELAGATLRHGVATRDREATFVPAPGLARPGPRTAVPGVVIAGAWTDTGWPATMESAVRSGRAAARELAGSVLPREVSRVG